MTEANESKNKLNDFKVYANAMLAGKLASSQEGQPYINSALDTFREEYGNSFGADDFRDRLYQGYINQGQIKELIEIGIEGFEANKSTLNFSELFPWYSQGMAGASDEQKTLFKAEFDKIGGENYGDVMEAISMANATLKLPDRDENKNKKEAAQKTMEKYGKVSQIMNLTENYTFENLRAQAVKKSKKDNFNGLEKILGNEQLQRAA